MIQQDNFEIDTVENRSEINDSVHVTKLLPTDNPSNGVQPSETFTNFPFTLLILLVCFVSFFFRRNASKAKPDSKYNVSARRTPYFLD
jgi:hypothetical protein